MTSVKPSKDCVLWNARGVSDAAKRAFFSDFIHRINPLAIAVVETKLPPDCSIRLAGHHPYHELSTHFTSNSSGVTILIHRAFNARTLDKLSVKF